MPRVASRLYPIMLSVAEAAAEMGVDRWTVYAWIEAGLPLYRIGTKRKILVADLVEYIRANLKRESRP
jgi:excisionase family DNA binding protein